VRPTSRLRQLLAAGPPILAPGAFDALSARLIAAAGFSAVYMTGYGVAASWGGFPDVGLLTMTEMAERARLIAAAVDLPVIADADTGYGNAVNVRRTVRCYEQAGVAALHLEDQAWPKKCGHMEGKRLIPRAEMVQKVRAALDARTDPDLVIIARTDAIAVAGIEEAVERANAYAEAGADIIFVDAPQSRQHLRIIAERVSAPRLLNWVEHGKTPPVSLDEVRDLGFRIVIFPTTALFAATHAMREALAVLRAEGTPASLIERMVDFPEFNTLIGLPAIYELERRYASEG